MIDLMRLEFKKVKARYFIGGILIIIVGLLFFANTSMYIVGSILMAFFLQILFTQTKNSYELMLSGVVIVLILFVFSGIIFKTSIKR